MSTGSEVPEVTNHIVKLKLLPHKRGHGYDFRDDPEESKFVPECGVCTHRARWAVARFDDWADGPVMTEQWKIYEMACGSHLSAVLGHFSDEDHHKVYDLSRIPDRG